MRQKVIFPFAGYEDFLRACESPKMERGLFEIGRFENGELFASVTTYVRLAHCLIVGSIAPPDDRLLSVALLSHTLKKEGAHVVTGILPYLGYGRQDKSKAGKSLATAWVGSVLQASGMDEAVTFDVHSERDKQLFPVPLVSIFPDRIFAGAIKKQRLMDAILVAPDHGAIWRCQAVNNATDRGDAGVPYFEKQRQEKGMTHVGPFGRIGPRIVIIDDMLDTGGTLVSACEKLVQAGTQEIYIMVTHGLFTGSGWKRLWSLGVQRIFCTDTIPLGREMAGDRRITVLSIVPLLREHINALLTHSVLRPCDAA